MVRGNMKKWDVDIDRLITVLSDRMYTDQALAGVRELISNSIDAKWPDKPVNIRIFVEFDSVLYMDDGQGIHNFEDAYGVIGSGARDSDPHSIGMFGIGRLSLISKLRDSGTIITRSGGRFTSWRVTRSGYEEIHRASNTVSDMEMKNRHGGEYCGFYLDFHDLDLSIDESQIVKDINRIFSLPLLKGLCNITINEQKLTTLIPEDYQKETDSSYLSSDVDIYYIEKQDGNIHYCNNGIEIRSENFTGIEAWVDEDYLDIKTDREGYVNNGKYQRFLKRIKPTLIALRPERTLHKLEVDFIDNVMKRFRVFMKKSRKTGTGPIIILPKDIPVVPGLTSQFSDQPRAAAEDSYYEVEKEPSVDDINDSSSELAEEKVPLSEPALILEEAPLDTQTPTNSKSAYHKHTVLESLDKGEPSPKRERIIVRGTRAVDLKTTYPMIFFEVEPFTLIFNTTHPVLKDMISIESMEPRVISVIFERMLECFYLKGSESLEETKARWTAVDNSLQDFL